MATSIINPTLGWITVARADCEPREGRRAVLVPLNFSNAATLTLSLTQLEQLQVISQLSCLYIDNSGNPDTLTVTLSSGQMIAAKPFSQGFYGCITAQCSSIAFSCQLGNPASITVFLLNYKETNSQWLSQ